jgi:putative acetyltransferase
MKIEVDDLTRTQVHELLEEHLANMHELSPPEQVFALDLEKLRTPDITFWTAWEDITLVGCGALKELSLNYGEIKSMRTPALRRRTGAGRALLRTIIEEAKSRGYLQLSLETGSHPEFHKAHALYRSEGFQYSGPFAEYLENPHSVFMSLQLKSAA